MKNLLDKILLLALAGGLGLLARAEAPTMFVDSLELKVGNITNKTEFTNFPVLVNVSEKLPGFLISRSGGAEGDGSAIRFSQKDENGEDVILSHELVPTLKDVDGKCTNFTFWVKIPTLNADTTIKMHWGLKTGMRPPVNRPTLVWSDYYGVWHHAGLSDTSVKDASGNGLDAEKILGTDTVETSHAYLAVPGGRLPAFESDGEFTFTANYKAADDLAPVPAAEWTNAPILFGTWSSNRKNYLANHGLDTGWGGGWWNQNQIIFRGSSRDPKGDGDDWMGLSNGAMFNYKNRTFLAFTANSLKELHVYAATDNTALTECTHRNSQGWITPGEDKMLRLTRFGAYEMTEARLSKLPRSADWLKEEHATLTNDSYVRVATGAKHEVYPAENYWIKLPTLSTLSWDGKSTMEVDLGKAALGGPKSFIIENAAGTKKYGDDFEAFKEKNDGYGAYRVVVSTATTDNGIPIKQLKAVIYFAYVAQVNSSTLAANQIMLFNDVKKRDSEEYLVAGQGLEAGQWETFATDDNGAVHIRQNCENGWTIHYGTIGNVASEAESLTGVNCLPFGPEDASDMVAMDYLSSTRPATDPGQAGAAILYNYSDSSDPAAIYSPYYERGIGEIYFDAVNANSEYRNRLELQYLVGDAAASATPDWESAAVKTAKLEVLAIKDGAKSSTWQNLAFVPLMMSGSTSAKSFYRVKAKIDDADCGVRFRIVRTDTSWGALGLTGPGKILVDNILVKDPSTKVTLSRIGDTWDKNRDFGKHLHGDRGTLTKRFPKVGDEKVRARVHVDYAGFGSDLASRVGNVAALIFKYRRRYLKSEIGEWKSIRMECESDDLSSGSTFITPESEPLDLGKKGDLPFDIEYAFEGALNPTSYKYVDYYGLGSDCAFDNGNGSAITLSYNGEKEDLKPTLGNDFFIRLREGDSDFEQMEVLWKFDGDNNVVTNNLRLIEDNLWTGAIAVTNADLRLGFKLRGVNKSDTYEDVYWRMPDEAEEATSSPYTDFARSVTETIREDAGFKWIAASLVRDTRQFIFRFNDKTGAISVCRGDYQDFNVWTDAAATNGVFVARTGKTGEDPVANSILQKRFPSSMSKNVFEDWDISVSTNSLWTEEFNTTWSPEQAALTDKLLGTDAVGEFTPNMGWIGKNFMYVNESRSRIYSGSYNSRAVLLSGDGSGSLKNTRAPDGIDEISFDARLGQQHAYNRVSSYVGFDTPTKDYLVSARVVMSNVAKDANQLGFDGQGTVSLFAYHNANGSYEFRMKRLSGNKLQIGLYRWYQEFGSSEIKVKELKSFDCYANGADNYTGGGQVPGMALCTQGIEAANTNEAYVVFFGVQTMTDDQGVVTGNQLYAGFSNGNPSGKLSNHPSVSEDIAGNNMYWNAIRWQDRVADDANIPLLRGGSFGFLSTDCPARFMRPAIHEQLNKFVDGRGNSYQTYKDQIALPTVIKELGYGDSMSDASFWYQWKIDSSVAIDKWYIPAVKKSYYGIVTPTITQDIRVSTSPAGKSSEEWSDFATVTVSSFEYKTYKVPAHTTTSVGVMLSSVKNDATKPTCDVILDNLEMTQWHAGTMTGIENHNDDFVYTGAWIEGPRENAKAELWPLRVATNELQTVRAPFLENGIGAISFSYDPSTLGENACLAIEYLTRDDENRLESYNVPNFTLEDDYQAYWKVYKTFTYDDLVSGGGHITEYLGERAGKSLIRLRVPQKVIEAAHEQNSGSYGRIDLTGIAVWDEPNVDDRSWTAWNVRLANKTTAESEYGSYDKLLNIDSWLDRVGTAGMSMELNNGACEELAEKPELYTANLPYIQSPVLKKPDGSAAEVTIGEITYRARKSGMTSQSAFVEVWAMRENGPHEVIATNELNSVSWQSFTVKNKASNVVSIRLVMLDDDDNPKNPGVYDRAIFDELFVTERVDPNVLVTFARPFRNHLDSTEPVPNISDPEEQPLCGEEWGIECKLALKQLEEVIDRNSIEVWCDYYIESYRNLGLNRQWGYGAWPKNSEKCGSIKLARATPVGDSTDLIYRMVRRDDGEVDYISPITNANTVVQYNFRIKFRTSQDDDEHESAAFNPADPNQWTVPEWYYPVNMNESFPGSAAYTIIDEVAPKRAWINEVNVWDSTYDDYKIATLTNAWVEIAVPSGVDMSNWRLEAVSAGNDDGDVVSVDPLMIFGASGCPRSLDSANGDHFAFYVAAHEKSSVANRVATLSFPDDSGNSIFRTNNAGTTFSERIPFALRLVRPTGIVDHEILVGGCENGVALDEVYKRLALNGETGHNKTVKAGWDGAKAYDDAGKSVTLSMKNVAVMSDLTAEAAENKWDNTMTETPGEINFANQIAKDYRIYPYDNMARVSCYVAGKCIAQALPGVADPSVEVQRISIEKGTPVSVYYYLEPWYQISTVKTNNVAVSSADMPKWNATAQAWVFTCAPSEDTTIEATSNLVPELAGLLDEGDHYGDAIVAWLQNEYGDANPEDLNTKIEVLGAGHKATPEPTYLSLKEKYWIGADPTKDGWLEFYAVVDNNEPEVKLVSSKDSSITNKLVKLVLHAAYYDGTTTNKLTRLVSSKYGVDSTNWKTLPKEDSFDSWTGNGPALQVVGWMLGKGLISGADMSDYVVPFEYYLLNESSFDDDFNRAVYVSDPFGPFSVVGQYKGWYRYTQQFVGWSLRLDDGVENIPGYSLNYLSEKNFEQTTEK